MTMSPSERVQQQLKNVPDVARALGTFVSQDGNAATVIIGASKVTIPAVGQYLPWPGDPVQLERRNGQLVMMGPAVQKPGLATVTDDTLAPLVEVTVDGRAYEVGYRDGYTPVVGDVVEVNWFTRIVQGKITTETAVPPVGGGEGAGGGPFDYLFQAEDSGSFRDGRWWTDDVYASDTNTGAWFYGPKIRNTLTDTATITAFEIFLPAIQASGGSPIFGIHGSLGKPGGNIAALDTLAVEPRSGWVALPIPWAEYGRDHDVGIGVFSGGFSIWTGRQLDTQSGTLRVRGTS